jgi:hypothetical protein
MRQHPFRSRAILAIVAALQLAAPGAASWADARLEFEGRFAPVHIESHSTSSCARVHAPDCGLCHFVGAPLATAASRTPQFAVAPFRRIPKRLTPQSLASAAWRSGPRPRAPPALS